MKVSIDLPPRGLGIARIDMPQISSENVNDFISFLKSKGVYTTKTKKSVSDLKMTQLEINDKKVIALMGAEKANLAKVVLISREGYILDGHHRIAALYNIDKSYKVDVIQINLKIDSLLKMAREYPKVFYKTVNEFLSLSDYIENQLNEVLITFGRRAYPRFGHVVILAGGAGCYPAGTEFFSTGGWKPIDQYSNGDMVLQYEPETGLTEFTKPDDYIDYPVDEFYTIKNRMVEFTTSLNHKHLTVNEKTGKYECLATKDLIWQHENTVSGNKRKLVTSFQHSGPGINLTDDEIKLKVAVYADGHMLPTKDTKVRMSFKKMRKIERFRYLLNINDIEYKEYKENEFVRFEFYYDSKDKEFDSSWYKCSLHQLKIVCDEVIQWDGSITEREARKDIVAFHSTSKASIDFVQFAFSATGHDTSIHIDEREDRTTCYSVYVNHSGGVGISKNTRSRSTTEIIPFNNHNGRMYCFTVPTGFFVVRQNGKIFVSGNSGKGFIKSNLLGIEGRSFDVDALKSLVMRSKKLTDQIMKETGQDIRNFDLRKPENVSKIHEIIGGIYNIDKKDQQAFYASVLTSHPDRKPNIIFDVTLKDMSKLESISRNVQDLGYDKRNIHIVWVLNEFKVAAKQNANRSRVVPEEILLATHEGAALTMKKIMDMGDDLKRYMDGDIHVAWNSAGIDSEYLTSDKGGAYIKRSDYMTIKQAGKPQFSSDKLSREVIEKIKQYVPKTNIWA